MDQIHVLPHRAHLLLRLALRLALRFAHDARPPAWDLARPRKAENVKTLSRLARHLRLVLLGLRLFGSDVDTEGLRDICLTLDDVAVALAAHRRRGPRQLPASKAKRSPVGEGED